MFVGSIQVEFDILPHPDGGSIQDVVWVATAVDNIQQAVEEGRFMFVTSGGHELQAAPGVFDTFSVLPGKHHDTSHVLACVPAFVLNNNK